jgi:hypothetical protein
LAAEDLAAAAGSGLQGAKAWSGAEETGPDLTDAIIDSLSVAAVSFAQETY